MSLVQDARKLLQEIGAGYMMSTAYDTAWVARLIGTDEPIGRQALEWLREHQLPDGSWGASEPRYYHDRLVSTLAAMTTLARWGNTSDDRRVQRARMAMDTTAKGLQADMVGETIGFEMIAPTLLAEARELGLIQRLSDASLGLPCEQERTGGGQPARRRSDETWNLLTELRRVKLLALPKGKISRHTTLAFSAEMVGSEEKGLLDVKNLQESNGSVGNSPSATAFFFLMSVHPGNEQALSYLRHLSTNDSGGIPDVAPFDVFERGWALWNLAISGLKDDVMLALCQPHLDYLETAWHSGIGIGFAAEYTPKDGDDTALVFGMLARFGRGGDIQALLRYERDHHFQCYDLEINPSVSANIHILGALRQAGCEASHLAVQKIVHFLERKRYLNAFWFDKWNASPYYPTAHAVISAEGFVDELAVNAVEWILDTQNRDGWWGYYGPTAEETAYCLQALTQWKRGGKYVPQAVLERGRDWLAQHMDPPYPPLWIGKCLYCPVLVVRSAILSALIMGTQE